MRAFTAGVVAGLAAGVSVALYSTWALWVTAAHTIKNTQIVPISKGDFRVRSS